MKYRLFVLIGLIALVLCGCACSHEWVEADCTRPRTCTLCDETEGEPLGHTWQEADCETPKTCTRCAAAEGEPLGHTAGKWTEEIDLVHCQITREQCCALCGIRTAQETLALETLTENGIFVFTPEEFMQRLAWIAEQNSDTFSYTFFVSDAGLQASVDFRGYDCLVQFFRRDTSCLTKEEQNRAVIWCVSLSVMGESDPDLRYYFYMACDPALSYGDETSDVDLQLSTAYLNAAMNGNMMGYYTCNDLLYEHIYLPEEILGPGSALSMVNIYASSFLD